MELYKLINKCTKNLEFLVISLVVSFFLLSYYDTLTSSNILIPLYILSLSFFYYIRLLIKSPGALIDFNYAQIKGLCKKCNRIVGSRTVHCDICNKCYHKRDHHCIVTGKCIASNNIKDLFFSVLFMFVYLILCLSRKTSLKEFIFFYKYTLILTGTIIFWISILTLLDKTTSEFFKMNTSVFQQLKFHRLKELFNDGIFYIVFPFLKRRTRIIL